MVFLTCCSCAHSPYMRYCRYIHATCKRHVEKATPASVGIHGYTGKAGLRLSKHRSVSACLCLLRNRCRPRLMEYKWNLHGISCVDEEVSFKGRPTCPLIHPNYFSHNTTNSSGVARISKLGGTGDVTRRANTGVGFLGRTPSHQLGGLGELPRYHPAPPERRWLHQPRQDVKISRRDRDETFVALETWSRC